MRCVLEHGKMIIHSESEFEAGYLGELLVNKMQGTAIRDEIGNISELSFYKKIDEERDLEELPDFIDEESAELVEELSDDEALELVEEKKEEMVVDMIDELNGINEDMTIIPREITDLGDIEIDDGLDIDLDNMEINFDELDID